MLFKEINPMKRNYSIQQLIILLRLISLFSLRVFTGLDHKKDKAITNFLKSKIPHIKCVSRGNEFWLNSEEQIMKNNLLGILVQTK